MHRRRMKRKREMRGLFASRTDSQGQRHTHVGEATSQGGMGSVSRLICDGLLVVRLLECDAGDRQITQIKQNNIDNRPKYQEPYDPTEEWET